MIKRQHAFPFLGLGVAFIALGVTGKVAFLGSGVVFLVLGFILLIRSRRS